MGKGNDASGSRMLKAKCTAVRADGQPCQAYAGPSGFCFWHDPERSDQVASAGRTGGKNRRRRVSDRPVALAPLSLADARGILAQEVKAVLEACEPGINRVRALAYALGTWAKLYELGELSGEIEQLKVEVEKLKQGGRRYGR